MKLHTVSAPLHLANGMVRELHRHHKPVIGHLFSLAVQDDSWTTHGVAIVGRPVARGLDDGSTVEVTRFASDGTPNGLLRALWRLRTRGQETWLQTGVHLHPDF